MPTVNVNTSKEEKYSSDYLPTKHEDECKSDPGSHPNEKESTQNDESFAQSVEEDASQEDNGAVQVDKEANSTTKADFIFLPSPPGLGRSDSLAISEIDSESDMNDSRNIGDLLATIENATKKVNEKREKLQESHNEDVFFASSETSIPSQYPEDNLNRVRSSDAHDSVYNEANGVAAQYQQQPHQMPDVMAHHPRVQTPPFIDVNTPIMMVPSQHLLHQMQVQQMQQMQMNFVPHQNPNSGLSTPMYTTTAALPHAAVHNGNPIMVHAPAKQNPGRRTMKLRLLEEIQTVMDQNEGSKRSIFARVSVLARKNRTRSMGDYEDDDQELELDGSVQRVKTTKERGELTISWYDGTSAVELQDHVRKSVEIKLRIGRKKLLLNLRVIDESVTPPEEIVLSPYIPDGSSFLLTFRIKDLTKKWDKKMQHHRAPPSPSAALSPPGELEQELQRQISDVLNSKKSHRRNSTSPSRLQIPDISTPNRSNAISLEQRNTSTPPIATSETHDILSQRLEKLNDTLLLLHDEGSWAKEDPNQLKTEKKQVIFVVANYFVLFLSLIVISAEIHERAPEWMAQIDLNISTVQNCATDKDALFQCVSEGNFSGLVASVVLWASESVATKRLFLLGFDSPKKLWRVVYECCVSSFCWGFSYIFIRRGLNPSTRPDCIRIYWKDAVYGSLAGFNAAFMKAVLKNFLPQADEILDVMEHRQVRLFNFLGRLMTSGPHAGTPVAEL
mmetsp:Transcript_25858/g.38322  ORF Transcript_25858/g.38322 Transcript_25858/m.38322 type:complete len:730 (+) Transcript_25858:131-2320(+)